MIDISDFGERIRAERQKQGLTLEEVAKETKIQTIYLNAIEENNFAILPPRVYATGFVRRYCDFLKMDVEALSCEFQSLAYANDSLEKVDLTAKKKKNRKSLNIPGKNILAGAVFLVLVLWAGSYLVSYISNWSVNNPPVTHEPQSGKQSVPLDNTPVQPAADMLQIDIEARQRCWLQVKVDGTVVFSKTMAVGDKQSFTAKQAITIKAGNAGGVDLSINKKPPVPMGQVNEVVEKTYDINSIGEEWELQ